MPFEFKFINRDDELYQLQQDFITEVIQHKKCSSYLISGRRGAGKSRLIHEFLNSLEADQRIAVNIPKFRRNVHAIEYACREDGAEPYRPFMEIKDQIERQQKGFRILRYAGMLLISFLPIHDVVDDLRKLVGEIGRGVTEEAIRSKETATFAKYLRMLKRRSKHIPIVLYIQNIQWIDDHSLKLLQTLIENEKSLWGMIILEENETPACNEKTTTIFRRLIDAQKMNRLTLKPMPKGFEIQLLEDRFRPRLFTNIELEHIYTLSEGCPGLLAELTNDWVRKGWIYQENSEWEKIPEFEHKIKVPYQKMLDLLITLLQDGMISPREQLLIDNFAQEWDIDKATVASMIDMIMKSREIGYDIVMRLHRGVLGEDAFLAHDKDMNKFIVEYVTNVAADEKEIVPREVKHPALLASRDIKRCDDGVLIVNDFFEGKTLREVNEEAHESHVMKVLKIAVQVAEGLEELHRNGLIHGYLRPESIIVTADGEIRLSALDASQLKLSETMDTEKYLGIVAYFSPEQVKGEKQGVQSDIFSFGVLLYELLTGERPFTGANRGELKESICYKNHPDLTAIQPPIPIEVQKILEKCLQKNPDDRYQSTKNLLDDLKRLIIESKIDTSAAESSGSHLTVEKVKRTAPSASRRKRMLIPAFAILLIACAAIYYQYFFKNSSWGFAAKTIVVEPFNVVNESDQAIGALPEMIKYLIIDDLLQSSRENVHVYSQKDFELAHDVKAEKPELIVSGALTVKDFDYELKVMLSRPGEKKDVLPFSFGDPSALLKTIITEITRSILTRIERPELKITTFTDRWGAFEQFYEGEQAWEKLDITKANE